MALGRAGTPSLQGQVALVTGAGSGIGRAMAEALAAAGASVAAVDLTPMNVEAVAAGITERGGKAAAYVEELVRGMPIRYLVDRVVEEMGRLDILVNAARVVHHAGLLDMDEWDWQRTLDVNLGGPFLLMQAAARIMQAQGGGVILNFAVDATTGPRVDGTPAFFAGKSGLAALSRAAAAELSAYNIRIHVLCVQELSGTDTQLHPEALALISNIAVLLCSPQAASLTGEIIRLDGA